MKACLHHRNFRAPIGRHPPATAPQHSRDPLLQRHNFLRNLLRVVGFVRADFHRTEREQHFRLSRRIFGGLQIFAKRILGFRQVFQFRSASPR